MSIIHKQNYHLIGILLVLLLVAVGCNKPNEKTTQEQNLDHTSAPARSAETLLTQLQSKIHQGGTKTGDILYDVRDVYDYQTGSDQFIVKKWWDGKAEEVFIPSIRSIVPGAGVQSSFRVSAFQNNPGNHNIIILGSETVDPNTQTKTAYQLNLATKQVKRMKINAILGEDLNIGSTNLDNALNLNVPNPPASKGKNQKLYLIDYINDDYRLLVELTGDETFNAGGLPGQPSYFDISFWNQNLIKYAVYNQSFKEAGHNPQIDQGFTVLKTYRELKLSPQ